MQILNSHGIDPVFILNLPEYCGLSLEELETILKEITEAIVETGDTLYTNEFSQHIKPYWSERLSELHDQE